MAGNARFTALLDACVLYPAPIADAMMSVHSAGLCTVKWTDRIDEEWISAVLRNRPDLTREKLTRRRDAMRDAVLDWEISATRYEALMPCLTLPDANDVHVLAAAISGHVDCVVTANHRDFPSDVMSTYRLEVIHPDDFLVYQLDLDPIPALAAFKEMRRRLRRPPMDAEAFAAMLERNTLVATAERIREAAELI